MELGDHLLVQICVQELNDYYEMELILKTNTKVWVIGSMTISIKWGVG